MFELLVEGLRMLFLLYFIFGRIFSILWKDWLMGRLVIIFLLKEFVSVELFFVIIILLYMVMCFVWVGLNVRFIIEVCFSNIVVLVLWIELLVKVNVIL